MLKFYFTEKYYLSVASKIFAILIIIIAVNEYFDNKNIYIVLRWSVCIASIISILTYEDKTDKLITILLTAITIVYNPLFPIYTHSKNEWIMIDLVTIVIFIYSIFKHNNFINISTNRANLIKRDAKINMGNKEFDDNSLIGLAIKAEASAHQTSSYITERLKTAILLYNEAETINPKNTTIYLNRSKLYLETRNPELAIQDLGTTLNINPDLNEALLLKARCNYILSKRYKLSIKEKSDHLWESFGDLNSYLSEEPADEEANQLLAECCYELEKIDKDAFNLNLYFEFGTRNKPGKWFEYYLGMKRRRTPKKAISD